MSRLQTVRQLSALIASLALILAAPLMVYADHEQKECLPKCVADYEGCKDNCLDFEGTSSKECTEDSMECKEDYGLDLGERDEDGDDLVEEDEAAASLTKMTTRTRTTSSLCPF